MSQSILVGGGGAALWVTGRTYIQGNQVVSPSDFNVYTRKTNGAGATDPISDSANWKPSGNQGGFLSNPRDMSLMLIGGGGSSVRYKSAGGASVDVHGAGTTGLAVRGASTSISVADTYVTIATLTGSGILVNVVSPTHSGAFTPTIRLTVDGVVYVFAPSATAVSSARLVLGPTTPNGNTAVSDGTFPNNLGDAGFSGSMTGGIPAVGPAPFLIAPESAIALRMGCLRFLSSCTIEAKASLLAAGAAEKTCAATYRMDI